MPNIKDGKVSLNLKVSEDKYNAWVEAAAYMRILNMSEFIRNMVDKGISLCQEK